MKRFFVVLTSCLLLFCAARAEEMAVCVPEEEMETVAMYEAPDEQNTVLMNYFSGKIVQVLDSVDGWCHVEAGSEHAPISGYMQEKNLCRDEEARWEVKKRLALVSLRQVYPVYAECREFKTVQWRTSQEEDIRICGFKKDGDKYVVQIGDSRYETVSLYMNGWTPAAVRTGFVCVNQEEYEPISYLNTPKKPPQLDKPLEKIYEKGMAALLSGDYAQEIETMSKYTEEEWRNMPARVHIFPQFSDGEEENWVWEVAVRSQNKQVYVELGYPDERVLRVTCFDYQPPVDIEKPREGFAVCVPEKEMGTVTMYKAPDEQSAVLMNYFSGAPVHVEEIENGWAKVKAGMDWTSLEGYIRADALRYGTKAERVIPAKRLEVEMAQEATIYESCSLEAKEKGVLAPEEWMGVCEEIIGFKEEPDGTLWFQLDDINNEKRTFRVNCEALEMSSSCAGFVHAAGEVKGEIKERKRFCYRRLESELTHEQAYERAIEVLLSGEHDPNGYFKRLPASLKTEAGIRRMRADVSMIEDERGEIQWIVCFENAEHTEQNVIVYLTPNGEAESELSYGVG